MQKKNSGPFSPQWLECKSELILLTKIKGALLLICKVDETNIKWCLPVKDQVVPCITQWKHCTTLPKSSTIDFAGNKSGFGVAAADATSLSWTLRVNFRQSDEIVSIHPYQIP